MPATAIETLLLDTSNLGSVRAAAATIGGRGRLDGLLLNAGIVHPPKERETTGDGHEVVFATNVLGHFALAGELLTPLAAASGRMVWLGSMSTSLRPYDPVDPQLVDGYTGWRAYVQSKVATARSGFEADRRLRAAGVPVASVVAHPGYSTSGRTPGILGVNEPSRSAGSPTTSRPRSRSPRSTAPGRWCGRSSIRMSRAASSGARGSGTRGEPRRPRRPGSPATPRSQRASGRVCEDATACAGRSRRPRGRRARRRRAA